MRVVGGLKVNMATEHAQDRQAMGYDHTIARTASPVLHTSVKVNCRCVLNWMGVLEAALVRIWVLAALLAVEGYLDTTVIPYGMVVEHVASDQLSIVGVLRHLRRDDRVDVGRGQAITLVLDEDMRMREATFLKLDGQHLVDLKPYVSIVGKLSLSSAPQCHAPSFPHRGTCA